MSSQARCTRCESPLEAGDLRCPICAQVVPGGEGQRTELAIEVLRCEGCGAAIEYDVKARAPRCPFCGATTRVETIEDPMEKAEGYLPFSVPRADAVATLKRWLGTLGWYRPGDLKTAATVDSLQPLYWVGWLSSADARISWTADTDVGAQRSRWAPCSGGVDARFENLVVSASRGLSFEETAAIVPGCRPESAGPEPEGADDPKVERFEVQRSLARERILAALEAVAREQVERHQLPGTRHRKVRTATLLRRLETRRLAFPAWVLAYRYRGGVYRAVICGQDASRIVGTAPVSWWRIAGAIAAGVAALAAIVALIVAAQ